MSHLYQISLLCVLGHLMCHRRLPTTDFQSCREGGRGGGGVKKCFLGLRQTALLSAEGKNVCVRITKKLRVRLQIVKHFWNQHIQERVPFFYTFFFDLNNFCLSLIDLFFLVLYIKCFRRSRIRGMNTFCIPVIISRHFLNWSTRVNIFNRFDYWDVANL
jgi:hypothetical protein